MRSILLSLLLLAVGGRAPLEATEVNRIVLRVNDRIATLHDFESRRAERVAQIQRAELTPEERREFLTDLGESILRQMYEELLLLSRADQLGVRASEAEVERNFRDTVESLGIQNEEELAQALAASGLTEAALRWQIQRGMIMQEVIAREVRPRVQLEEEEMRRYYRDNIEDFEAPQRWRVKDAVALSTDVDSESTREIANEIRNRIVAGESLDDAARDFVELGQVTVIELGWVGEGDLESSLETALVGLQAGAVSEPVEGRGGLHVLHVEEYEAVRAQTFPEVEDQVAGILQQNRFGNEMQDYLEELQSASFVSTAPPPGAEGFALDLGREVLDEANGVFDDPILNDAGSSGPGGEISEPETDAQDRAPDAVEAGQG